MRQDPPSLPFAPVLSLQDNFGLFSGTESPPQPITLDFENYFGDLVSNLDDDNAQDEEYVQEEDADADDDDEDDEEGSGSEDSVVEELGGVVPKPPPSTLARLTFTKEQKQRLRTQIGQHTQLLIQTTLLGYSNFVGQQDARLADHDRLATLASRHLLIQLDQSTLPQHASAAAESVVTRATWQRMVQENPDMRGILDSNVLQAWRALAQLPGFAQLVPEQVITHMTSVFEASLVPDSLSLKELRGLYVYKRSFTVTEDELLRLGAREYGVWEVEKWGEVIVGRVRDRFLPGKWPGEIEARWEMMFKYPLRRIPRPHMWTEEEHAKLQQGYEAYGKKWEKIRKNYLPNISYHSIRAEFRRLTKLAEGIASRQEQQVPKEQENATSASVGNEVVGSREAGKARADESQNNSGVDEFGSGMDSERVTKRRRVDEEEVNPGPWTLALDRELLQLFEVSGDDISLWQRSPGLARRPLDDVEARLDMLCGEILRDE